MANLHKKIPCAPPALMNYPSKLFVETTSRCNLNCFMCVKQAGGSGGMQDGDLSAPLFAALRPAFPHLEALLLNGVGEPLLHPSLEDFIRLARREVPADCWIGFQSNGVLLDERRALTLLDAGLDKICLSVDSVSHDNFRKVREGGELGSVERALGALGGARRETLNQRFRIGVEFVLMRDNIDELPATLQWAAARGADFGIVSHLLPYDGAHAEQAAYGTCTDAAIEIFQHWQEKARRAGVDILRYLDVKWRYSKTAEEQRIIRFIDEMKEDAEGLGIHLDIKKLIGLDRNWLKKVEDVFEQARQVAHSSGLDLKLPEIVPKQERQCHFIEDGSAFVSWDGDIHPCYFLWHRYSCFASGWNQLVKPKSFGNIAANGILETWNNPAFRTFRQSVLDYDYPYCASCGLAPCDYVQTEDFEQDCHIKSEPCGSCLWCMGLFQCLR
jgi:putative metalloenzyme radical SAM/SPASM domain maturase